MPTTDNIMETMTEMTDVMDMDTQVAVPMDTTADMISETIMDDDPGDGGPLTIVKTAAGIAAGIIGVSGAVYGIRRLFGKKKYTEVPAPTLMTSATSETKKK